MRSVEEHGRPTFIAVAGVPGSGKSTYARRLAAERGAVLLDLDTMTSPLVDAVTAALGVEDIDDQQVRRLTRDRRYEALVATAVENVRAGRDVVAVAPFTQERADAASWSMLAERLAEAGAQSEMRWCDTPREVVRGNLARRSASRDSSKMTDLDAYLAGLDFGVPKSPHLRIPWVPQGEGHAGDHLPPSSAGEKGQGDPGEHGGLTSHGRQRLDNHARSLALLAPAAVHPVGGFGELDEDNRLDPSAPIQLYNHCRITHVAALEVMRGCEGLRPMLDVGRAALRGRLADAVNGGWFEAGDNPAKAAYAHAFVVLAAASLTAAEHPGGRELLDDALAVVDTHFWREDDGMVVERWDASWSQLEPYRGANSNMHMTEAFLAAGDVLGDRTYLLRAQRILERTIHQIAKSNDWRLPEHFDTDWHARLDYNRDNPRDRFRPFGVTIGHLLEWARLALNAHRALGDAAPGWLIDDARGLFDAAVQRGWAVDGRDGFVYTTDFDDTPIVRERLHWVCCEGIATAWSLYEATGEVSYHDWFVRLWRYADEHLVDHERGGWFHELSPENEPSATVWSGKPDLYHAYQATIVPLLPGMVSFAGAVSRPARR